MRETHIPPGGQADFQAYRDVHAVAVHVGAVQDGVAQVDADAEADTAVGLRIPVQCRHATLDYHRGLNRALDAVEYGKQRVSRGLSNNAAIANDRRVDEFAPQPPQPRNGASIIQTDQPTVADHISMHDDRQFPAVSLRIGNVGPIGCRLHWPPLPGFIGCAGRQRPPRSQRRLIRLSV